VRARADAQEALELARDHDWPSATAQARAALAFSHVHGGHLDLAVEHGHAVLDLAARHGWTDTPWPAGALVVLAVSDLLGGNPEQALAGVTRAEGVAGVHHAEYRNALATVRGAAEHDSGRLNEGWRLLRAARRQALAEDLDDQHVAFVGLLEQQAALRLGRAQEAAEIVQAVGARLSGTSECILLEARQRWTSTRDAGTRRVLGPALDGSNRRFVTSMGEADALVLDAEIALAAGHQQLVRHRVREALQHANDHGTLRPLLSASPALHDYLQERRGSFGPLDHTITRVLARAPRSTSSPATVLTEREQDVLELLPSLQSVDEIAKDLAVSRNTVKTHMRSIYRKLGADDRRDAVHRARRAGLLTAFKQADAAQRDPHT
jgi:LuxR family maltose regulon positive regulatory protein